ncbi:nickel pincer cofactor biosynthesis protein LarB [Anaeromicropila herbilytica]|uniref:1-(5-phosphoribosyl)-5-amino-4-imidazole-carboxyl ate carboxylase n=1 Tax=Anaeromicropila herbilytica TaxID=2785025 RepID=A0A7R7EIL4_9FIRM|nr:nickel pincer cofactor biosynthesis protein LarB [Anaeromicropila herbilytica]BCN29356.1 1-(5-phosphoribosyl)-5-amino-4-imidazole-carboxyl ate carboxylase [Anaeromicropila herbilytica]
MDVNKILNDVKIGNMSIEDAEEQLKKLPYEDLGYAKLDHHRKIRQGFAEVIFCQSKTDEHLVQIYEDLYKQDREVFGTRASEHQYECVKNIIPEIQYDRVSRILKYENKEKVRKGCIVICTGGTADIPVAEEAAQTAEFFGNHVERLYDVGVAGVHRLLSNMDTLRKGNCVVAVAGMEGALASVVAGLVEKPVIAVPTSVGYGANFGGMSALLTMINSCANGISVVNIDNGYGAGYISSQINRLAIQTN